MRILLYLTALLLCLTFANGCGMENANPRALSSSLGDMTAAAENADDHSILVVEDGSSSRSLNLDGVTVKQLALGELQGRRVVALVTDEPDNRVRLYEIRPHGLEEIWQGLGSLNPWKVLIADVDGNGETEIAVGVYKEAQFHPVMAKRPFIYGWDGEDIYPKWLGSRLSRPFTDFTFADSGSGPRLISVEETREGDYELAVYEWNGFGFTREWSGFGARDITELWTHGDPGAQHISAKINKSIRTYVLSDSSYELEEAKR